MTAIYRNEHQAVAMAMSVDRISTCRPASWQADYRSGFTEELTSKPDPLERLTTIERLAQDAMTRSLIKRRTDRMTFLALVAKYGADDRERAAAINELADMLDSPAPSKFRRVCVWAWACVAFRRGIKTRLMESGEKHRSTMYRWRKGIVAQLDDLEQLAESILSPELLERGLTEAE